MALVPFNEVINFTRGTGATRINAAGLIVGVDFSSTSNTITTGSKTFTLTADANVNRDWPVGSSVRAVDQVGGGVMVGTVTSYTPSTQALVINVTSITGSGTSTNWRIGSLEVRRDSNGVLVEGQGSNLFTFSDDVSNAAWGKTGVTTVTPTASPSGNSDFWKVQEDTSTGSHNLGRALSTTSGLNYVLSFYVSAAGRNFFRLFTNFANNNSTVFNLSNGTIVSDDNVGVTSITLFSPGVYKISRYFVSAGGNTMSLNLRTDATTESYTGDGSSGIRVWGLNLTQGGGESHIPTTTASVTRAADSLTATATTLAALRQGEGTLVVTAQNPDNGLAQKRALRLTGANGEIRIGKQGTGTTANFTKMVEGAGLRLMGTANSLISNNGLESAAVSATFAETGVLTALGQSNAVTFNGTDTFGRIGSTEESFLNSTLTTRRMLGLGGSQINGAHWTGTSFIAATAVAGRVLKTVDGISYRSINAPAITQSTNEVTSGLVGAINRVVIVGNGGFIATSDDDGETWTSRTSGTANNINGVSFGSVGGTNYFIAVGNGAARYSTDGINWLAATGATGNLFDIHIANGIAVAVNTAGLIFTSTNGTSFTQATNSNTTNVLAGVTYSTSLNLWISCGAGGTVVTATNPSGTWTLQSSGVVANLNEVGIFNNAIYVVGDSQTLLTSTNGTTYTSLTAGVTGTLIGIAASPTTLIITGASGAMASSTDGTTFTSRTNNTATLNGIAFGAGKFVSVGNAANGSGYIATIDPDGTVTRRVSGTTQNIVNVKAFGSVVFALANNGVRLRSIDAGQSWSAIATDALHGQIQDIAFNGSNLYITVGQNGRYSTSTDGITFAASALNGQTTQVLNGIDFANGTFVVVGNAGVILTTTNGTTYTLRTSNTTQNLTSVMYSIRDSRWYAAGAAGTLLFSEDNGVTWQSVQNAGLGAINAAGTSQVNALLPQWQTGTNKIAISYKANDVKVSINGSAPYTDTSASIPTVDSIIFGDTFNGYITRIKHVNEVLNVQTESTL